MTNNENLVAFRCPPELLEALDRMAAEHQVARSEMIRLLIDEAVLILRCQSHPGRSFVS